MTTPIKHLYYLFYLFPKVLLPQDEAELCQGCANQGNFCCGNGKPILLP
jgi:hypothetical protein